MIFYLIFHLAIQLSQHVVLFFGNHSVCRLLLGTQFNCFGQPSVKRFLGLDNFLLLLQESINLGLQFVDVTVIGTSGTGV